MMRYYYFPGCSMAATAKGYQQSIDAVTRKIGMDLVTIPDWNCCGATAAHTMNEMMALALPARNLARAEADGGGMEIAVACAACYSRMQYSRHAVLTDEKKREEIEEIIGMPCSGANPVVSFLEIFSRPEVMEAVRSKLVKNLNGLKVACYYGCLTSRPSQIARPDDPENPMQMDGIVSLTGAVPVSWDFKTECCGASHQVDAPKAALPLIQRILNNAREHGADCIVTACPLCALNLDMRQSKVMEEYGGDYALPVYQFTELLALCMGVHPRDFGLHTHFTPAVGLMRNALKKDGDEQ